MSKEKENRSLAAKAWDKIKLDHDPAFEATDRTFQEEKNHAAERIRVTGVASDENLFEQAVLVVLGEEKSPKVADVKGAKETLENLKPTEEQEEMIEAAAGEGDDKKKKK